MLIILCSIVNMIAGGPMGPLNEHKNLQFQNEHIFTHELQKL